MLSKTSFFNKTLFCKNLTRFWPLWGMASFVGVLFPLAFLLEMLRGNNLVKPLEVTGLYYDTLIYAVPIISLLYAALCAMVVWSYLYNARSVGLMHTLPVRREGLFVTGFLSGMTMMLIPYVITGAVCVLTSLAFGCFDAKGLLVTILGVLGESFFYFASATFAAFVTGNLFAMPAIYLLLHFLSVLLDWLLSTLAQGFLFGMVSSYSGIAEWLSPTVFLETRLEAERVYTETLSQLPGQTYTQNVLTEIRLDELWLVGVYVLVGVALLALAYFFYRRRNSESAGDVVAVNWLRPVFRYGVSALAALLGGIALYEIFWTAFQGGRQYDALPMAVCMAVAGTIGYFAASMLLAKSLRVFGSCWKGLALVLVGCVAVCCALNFDVLGIETRMPAPADIEQLEVYVAGNHYSLYAGKDDALIEEFRKIHQSVVADKAYIYQTEEKLDQTEVELTDEEQSDTEISPYNPLRLTYDLKDGRTVQRWYSLPITRGRLAQVDTYDHLLDSAVNSAAMKARRAHLDDEQYTPTGGGVYVQGRGGEDLSSREAEAILEALRADIASGAWGNCDWFQNSDAGAYAIDLNLHFKRADKNGEDWINIVVWPEMTATIDTLKDLKFLTDQNLVTNRQLYPENYEMESESYGGDEAVVAFEVPEETAEIAVDAA